MGTPTTTPTRRQVLELAEQLSSAESHAVPEAEAALLDALALYIVAKHDEEFQRQQRIMILSVRATKRGVGIGRDGRWFLIGPGENAGEASQVLVDRKLATVLEALGECFGGDVRETIEMVQNTVTP